MTFPLLIALLRRDYDFRTRKQEKHHTGPSPMKELNFPMIDGFPPDYMHSVCLGLVRNFLILLRAMPIGHKARLSLESWNLLNDNIEQQSLALSVDFPRKCRGVVDLDRWKASELRQFLLYIAPVVLRDILHPDVYECFIHLFYNIHLFSHLFNFVKLCSCLDRFSCFPYESELGHLKHYIHGPKPPAVQLYRRLAERVRLDAVERKIFLDYGCRFLENFPDNCILLDGKPVVIVDFFGDTIEYQKPKTLLPFYTHVLALTDVLVFQCSDLQHTRLFASVDQISCKCLSFLLQKHSGTLPKCPLKSCTYKMYRQCSRFSVKNVLETFPDALSAQQSLTQAYLLCGAEPMNVRQSRRKQYVYQSYYDGCSTKKRLSSDFTDRSDRDSSGDHFVCKHSHKPTKSKKTDVPRVPGDASMICGMYFLFHYHHLKSISSSTYTTLPAVGDPEPCSSTPILRTNPPNSKASVISPDLSHLILNASVPTSSSEALNEPPLPLSSTDDLRKYEGHLRDGPRYAWLEAGDVRVYVTNVLTRTSAPRLAALLDWRGINEKEAFGSTRLAQGLIYSKTEKFPNTNLRQMREIVHCWLENERQKVRKRLQRATKSDK
ncbi:hypothetical protein T265_00787 [Opisthorchis viverrini]|uniref:Uncharacterized protein n=1 Tax=Opisthorchis viverrini TaxID=6198 RepID=A0A075ABR6_OPIVI|nr:hypothetical protein T265_00787 [Opisthorchis viverrini]KER33285.1 hypothetical protein T265_00787 [Opisthorchis viverrini]